MSNINIENLSFDSKMDAEALDAIAGGWGWGSVKRTAKKAYKSVKRNVVAGVKWYGGCFGNAYRAAKYYYWPF